MRFSKKPKEKDKMYVIRKYIKAPNLKQAIKLEPKTDIHDAWIDNDWREEHLADAIGFTMEVEDDDDE
jgi:hypothetical protein